MHVLHLLVSHDGVVFSFSFSLSSNIKHQTQTQHGVHYAYITARALAYAAVTDVQRYPEPSSGPRRMLYIERQLVVCATPGICSWMSGIIRPERLSSIGRTFSYFLRLSLSCLTSRDHGIKR